MCAEDERSMPMLAEFSKRMALCDVKPACSRNWSVVGWGHSFSEILVVEDGEGRGIVGRRGPDDRVDLANAVLLVISLVFRNWENWGVRDRGAEVNESRCSRCGD